MSYAGITVFTRKSAIPPVPPHHLFCGKCFGQKGKRNVADLPVDRLSLGARRGRAWI